MADITAKLDARKALKTVTLVVDVRMTHMRVVNFRLRIAVMVVRLAAWIAGTGIRINRTDVDEASS
jgi:hypothetical protein